MHVAKRGIDTALGGDCVTPRREELRNTGRVEAGLGKTEGRAQARTTSADDDSIVLMVLKVRQLVNCYSLAL